MIIAIFVILIILNGLILWACLKAASEDEDAAERYWKDE